jgi:ArsR family metal-binding transcriptional regulator
MADVEKIYHNLKSKAIGLKSAAEMLPKCAPEKRNRVIALMREAAGDIARLLSELETEHKS